MSRLWPGPARVIEQAVPARVRGHVCSVGEPTATTLSASRHSIGNWRSLGVGLQVRRTAGAELSHALRRGLRGPHGPRPTYPGRPIASQGSRAALASLTVQRLALQCSVSPARGNTPQSARAANCDDGARSDRRGVRCGSAPAVVKSSAASERAPRRTTEKEAVARLGYAAQPVRPSRAGERTGTDALPDGQIGAALLGVAGTANRAATSCIDNKAADGHAKLGELLAPSFLGSDGRTIAANENAGTQKAPAVSVAACLIGITCQPDDE